MINCLSCLNVNAVVLQIILNYCIINNDCYNLITESSSGYSNLYNTDNTAKNNLFIFSKFICFSYVDMLRYLCFCIFIDISDSQEPYISNTLFHNVIQAGC